MRSEIQRVIDQVHQRLLQEEGVAGDLHALLRICRHRYHQSNPGSIGTLAHGIHRSVQTLQDIKLLRLLDVSSQAEGVRIFIGGESQVVPFEDLSVVSAPYEVDGQVVGTLGVIGPTRMPYDRMIEIVDITSKLVTNALSHRR